MANKADGSVSIKANVDVSDANKQLNKLQKDIEKTEAELNDKRTEKTAVTAQLEAASKAAKDTESRVAALKKQLADVNTALGFDANGANVSPAEYIEAYDSQTRITSELAEQERILKTKNASVEKLTKTVAQYDNTITRTTQKLDKMKSDAGELEQKIARSERNTSRMASATAKASKSASTFGKRLRAVVRSALVFTVITKALAELREWVGAVIKTNDKATEAMSRLKAAALTLAQPLVDIVIPAFTKIVNVLTSAAIVLGRLFAAFSGKSYEDVKNSAESLYDEQQAIEGVGDAAKKAAGQLASFDEINKLGSDTGATATAPNFAGLGIESLPEWLKSLTLDLEAKIGELRWSWDEGTIAQSKDLWITALTGMLGAVIGAIFGGFTGTAIGLLLGAAIGLISCTFADKTSNPSKTKNDIINVISAILGGALGAKFGGIPGMIIGLLLGAGISIVSLKFTEGHFTGRETEATLLAVLGGMLGAILGGLFAGIHGAVLGFALGAVISLTEIDFKEGSTQPQKALAAFRVALFAILGAILGSMFGGPVGMGVGLLLGFTIGFASVGFDKNLDTRIRTTAQRALRVAITTIVGALIGLAFGGGVFGGIVGGIIGLAFGLAVTLTDAQIDDQTGLSQWSPRWTGKGITSSSFSTFSMPHLATGAVIPPNREFLAVLGDQTSGTNIEAPESLIRKIVREEAGGNTELLAEILDAIRAGRVMKVDKRILAQVTAEGINDMTKQTGKPVLLY